MVRGLCVFVLLLPLSSASAQTIQAPGAPATAPYTDAASGMTFPVAVGEFKRFRIHRAGENVSAGYAYITAQARVAATIFVDRPPPAPDSCRAMADADRSVVTRQPGTTFGELAAPGVPGYAVAAFVSRADGPLGVGEHYYFCREGWVVQFLFQHAAAFDAAPLEAAFLRDLPLPPEKH